MERAQELSIGMTERELFEIMGKPALIRVINPADEIPLFQDTSIRSVIQELGQVVEYEYGQRYFGESGYIGIEGIYLDRDRTKIVGLQVQSVLWDVAKTRPTIEILALFASCVALPWISLRIICRRLKKGPHP
jgi:hypothetical protein